MYKSIYNYLGYRGIEESSEINELIDECLDELNKLSGFKYIYQEFSEPLDFLKSNAAYLELLKNTEGYLLIATTLGKEASMLIKKYSKSNLTKSVVMDACASALIEYKADEFEKNIDDRIKTYRFCPGYSNTNVCDNKIIYKILKAEKIGITMLDSGLMIPEKSMIGIIGIGKKNEKTCNSCILNGYCNYRKEGITCYKK